MRRYPPMASAYRHRLIAALGLTLLACDPGYTVDVRIVVPDAVASAYTPAQRGLLLAQISPAEHETELYAITVVCGEGGSFTTGTGDLGYLPDTTVRAWIEPLPADDTRPCGEVPNADGDGIDDPDLSAYTLDDDEPQAREDIDGAGGCSSSNLADIELTIANP